MLIKASENVKKDLFSLWKEAFGDEDGYIELFFKTLFNENIRIFAESTDNKIVSVLYLMRSYIKTEDKIYDGYYLYAAATQTAYRGKGIMGKLINEAKDYVISQGKDFISLVPGEEYLYSYYKKFGFEPVMYRGKDIIESDGTCEAFENHVITFDEYFRSREKELNVSAHCFYNEVYEYAEKCYEYLGLNAVRYADVCLLSDIKNNRLVELLTASENDSFISILPKGIYTVYSASGKEKEKFGMVWFSDKNKSCKKIYMNIALD